MVSETVIVNYQELLNVIESFKMQGLKYYSFSDFNGAKHTFLPNVDLVTILAKVHKMSSPSTHKFTAWLDNNVLATITINNPENYQIDLIQS